MDRQGNLSGIEQCVGRLRLGPCRDGDSEITLPSLKVPPLFLRSSLKKVFVNRKMGGTCKERRVISCDFTSVCLRAFCIV